jgi:hypothetical protein
MRVTTLILTALFCSTAYAQTNRTEDKYFLYWRPKTEIQFSDFRKTVDSVDLKMFEKYKTKSLSNIQIHCIVDYPKKAKQIKTIKEKWYISPVFCKECSPLLKQDSTELQQTRIYFDIAEYCSRVTRKKIASLETEKLVKDSNGFIAAAFPGLIDKMYDLMFDMFSSYKREVIIEKQPNAQYEWRKTVDQLLESTKDFSTTENECNRFINNKPFSDEYKVTYELYGK